jgi:hypothetical protein
LKHRKHRWRKISKCKLYLAKRSISKQPDQPTYTSDPTESARLWFYHHETVRQSLKPKDMKRTILVMCTWLCITIAGAQDERDRLVSINPIRNGDGSFVRANNPLFFNNTSTDTTTAKRQRNFTTSNGDPYAFRINSIQAQCDQNSLQLSWTTVQQQNDADRFDIEQSSDGGVTWINIGTVPATRFKIGNVGYSFMYNKSVSNVDLRVAAVNIGGERRYSSVVRSACSNTNMLSVDNLVSSTANVRIASAKTQNIKMILTNQSGLVVQARTVGLTQGVNSVSLDMSSLQTGVYMLTVIWPGNAQQSVKIVKQ